MDRRIKKSYTKRSYKSTFYDSQQEISANIFSIYLTPEKNQATIYHHTTSFSYFDLHLPTSVIKGHEYSTAIPFPFFHRSKPGSRSS